MSRPLSARSLIASTLLGTVPPTLPGTLLIALAVEFGISDATARVALSRMTSVGEVTATDGRYALGGSLLERHERQQEALVPTREPWAGEWEQVVVRPGSRPPNERSALRAALHHLKFGEFRDGIWLRPANLDPGRLSDQRALIDNQADWFRTTPTGDPRALLGVIFDLTGWATRSRLLSEAMEAELVNDATTLAAGFATAAAVLRQLVADPELPHQLAPVGWPAEALRHGQAHHDRHYRQRLGAFFATVKREPTS